MAMKLKLAKNTPSGVRSKYIVSLGVCLLLFSTVFTLQQNRRARLAHEAEVEDNSSSAASLNLDAQGKRSLTTTDEDKPQSEPQTPVTSDQEEKPVETEDEEVHKLVASSSEISCQAAKSCEFTLKTENDERLDGLELDKSSLSPDLQVSIVRDEAGVDGLWRVAIKSTAAAKGEYTLRFIGSKSNGQEPQKYEATVTLNIMASEQPATETLPAN